MASDVVVGLDPGLTNTGVVVLSRDYELLSQNLIQAKSSAAQRLYDIEWALTVVLCKYENPSIFLEGYAYNARYQRESLAELGGVLRRLFYMRNWPYWVIPPLELKQFVTGTAKANKNFMKKRTREKWSESFKSDHICDAYGLARLGVVVTTDRDEHLTAYESKIVAKIRANREDYFEPNTAKRIKRK